MSVLTLTVIMRETIVRGREGGGENGDKVSVLLRGRECSGGDGESGDKVPRQLLVVRGNVDGAVSSHGDW